MRWKLIIVTSLLAAVAGAGASLAIIYGLLGSSVARVGSPDIPTAGALSIPVGLIIFAAVFVYRHTSRRRALQAVATVLCALVLTLAVLAAASALLTNRLPRPLVNPDVDGSNAWRGRINCARETGVRRGERQSVPASPSPISC